MKKDPKKAKTVDKDVEQCESMDVSGVHEAVLQEMRETFSLSEDLSDPVARMVPMIVTAVSVAVEKAVMGVVKKLEERLSEKLAAVAAAAASTHPSQERLMSTIRRLTYENDRLAQYTRRESIRIAGIPQAQGETVEEVEAKAIKVLTDAGMEVVPEDLAAVHRVGKPARGPRGILVKFVSRRKRREAMLVKKNLKGKDGYQRVFINDDLTPLRGRLLGYVKSLPNVERAWTKDGKILCAKKVPVGLPDNERPRPIVVDDPDDLFKLGVEAVDYSRLGLSHLMSAESGLGGDDAGVVEQ
jgi:hypothetical protein